MRHWFSILVCTVIWSDFFPVPTAELRYGPGVRQEIKVELCDHWSGKTIVVWSRLFREVADRYRTTEVQITPWDKIKTEFIKPFQLDPAKSYDQETIP
jgi:hypothetical protein